MVAIGSPGEVQSGSHGSSNHRTHTCVSQHNTAAGFGSRGSRSDWLTLDTSPQCRFWHFIDPDSTNQLKRFNSTVIYNNKGDEPHGYFTIWKEQSMENNSIIIFLGKRLQKRPRWLQGAATGTETQPNDQVEALELVDQASRWPRLLQLETNFVSLDWRNAHKKAQSISHLVTSSALKIPATTITGQSTGTVNNSYFIPPCKCTSCSFLITICRFINR